MNNTTHQVGDKVRANVTAQGMLKGQLYTVTAVHTRRCFTGGYTSYTLEACDRSLASPKAPVGNGHLVLSAAE